jgi:hypothetical protein
MPIAYFLRRIILSFVAWLAVPCLSTLSHSGTIFEKQKIIEHKMCDLIFSTILSEALLILKITQRYIN